MRSRQFSIRLSTGGLREATGKCIDASIPFCWPSLWGASLPQQCAGRDRRQETARVLCLRRQASVMATEASWSIAARLDPRGEDACACLSAFFSVQKVFVADFWPDSLYHG